MSLNGIPRGDLEFRKFTEVGGEPAVRTTATGTFSQTGLHTLGRTTMLTVFSTSYQAGGSGDASTNTGHSGSIDADATNDRAQFTFNSTAGGGNDTFGFSFSYEVI
jgi:hypothetical protein